MSDEWFGEDPAAERRRRRHEQAGRRQAVVRRRRFLGLAAVAILLLGGVAAAAAYRQLDGDDPPPVELKTFTLTVPEGYSRAQTAELAREAGVRGDYLKASEGEEGFLFPDTYELERGAAAADLVALQLRTFETRIAAVDLRYARSKNLTERDVVTIASMVEEEALLDSERRQIAAVIYNRLRARMPLGIDATLRYGLKIPPTKSITSEHLASDSPYNTRKFQGLTPTPIANPGIPSIQAAAHPANVDYLYFIRKSDCKHHFFTSSLEEFNNYTREGLQKKCK